MPEFPENPDTDVDNDNEVMLQRREETNPAAAATGKRHYVIDYFVIVDFAIYDRCTSFMSFHSGS